MSTNELIKRQGDHHNLICFRKAELLFDMTYHFAHTAFEKGDRTIDQMVQAARSGKQNIVEGNADIETSLEMGIKLLNVAKASLHELREDYEDYLKTRGHWQWDEGSKELEAMRRIGREHNDGEYFMQLAQTRPPETIANMVIVLLKQADYLLHRQIQRLSDDFVQDGGFSERMTRIRKNYRENCVSKVSKDFKVSKDPKK